MVLTGKSTLIKIITGQLLAQEGKMSKNESAVVACFTQHHVDQLDLTINPMEYMIRVCWYSVFYILFTSLLICWFYVRFLYLLAGFLELWITGNAISPIPFVARIYSFIYQLFPESRADQLRSHLGRLGLGGNLALQIIGSLSGGQKSRVALATITFKEPHLLILDEPTNRMYYYIV